MDWYMRMVQYVIQVQQLGLRVGAQKNRLNGIEVILFEYLLCISGFRRKVFIIIIKHPWKYLVVWMLLWRCADWSKVMSRTSWVGRSEHMHHVISADEISRRLLLRLALKGLTLQPICCHVYSWKRCRSTLTVCPAFLSLCVGALATVLWSLYNST